MIIICLLRSLFAAQRSRMRSLLLGFALLGLFVPVARAIEPQPYAVGLGFSARIWGVGNADMYVYGESYQGSSGTEIASSISYDGSTLETPVKTAWLKPGKIYTVVLGWSGLSGWSMSFIAPEGYATYINGVRTDLVNNVGNGGPGSSYMYQLELRPLYDQSLAPFGDFTGIKLGKSVTWSIGLGGIRTGRTAGRISFREQDISSNPASRAKLYYGLQPNNDQLAFINDPSSQTLRQVITAQAIADLTDDGSGGTWIKFHNWHVPTPPSFNGTLWVFSDTPWKTIHLESPATNELKITESEDGRTRVSWLKLTSGSVGSGNYTWVLKEGNETSWSSSGWLRTTIQTSTLSSPDRTIIEEIRTGTDTGTVVAKNRYLYKTYAWGEELSQQEAGYSLGNSVTTTYGYYTDSSARGNYRQLKWVKDTTGGWTGYQRYDDWDRRGQTQYVYRPWKDSPAAPTSESNTFSAGSGLVESLDYSADWTGRYTRVNSRQQTIGGTATGKSTYLQQDVTSSGPNHEVTTASDYYSSSGYLTTYSETVRADADADLAGHPLIVETPDGQRTVYSMTRGTFNHTARTFAVSSSGHDWRILVARGSKSSAGATQVSSYDGQSFYGTYMVPNKSTLEVKVINNSGHLFRSELHVYTTGSGFDATPVSYEDLDFSPESGRFRTRVASNGETTSIHFSGGQILDFTGPDGVEMNYTYDNLWRVATIKKVGVALSGSYQAQPDIITTNTYDGANRIKTQVVSSPGYPDTLTTTNDYDLAGRLTSQTPPGLGATTTAYDPAARTVTVTAPDTGTTISTGYPDGQQVSVTGTATVAKYSSYGVETDGRRYVQANLGTSTSPRWSKSWMDWLGRPTESRSPGFSVSSQSDFVTQNVYDTTTGLLTKVKRVNASNVRLYADTLYYYNTLSELARSGLDVDNDGNLVLASMDRIANYDTSFESYSSAWWVRQTTAAYSLNNDATGFTTGVKRTRLTGFSGSFRAETRTTDIEGNVTTVTTNASGKTITNSTTTSGISNTASSIVYNGVAVAATGFDGFTSLAQADSLGRPWKSTDSRSLVTTTAYYANTGLVQKIIDSANHDIALYSYDTNGRVVSQADALGALTYTAYDKRNAVIRQWGNGTYPVEYEYDSTYGDRTKLRTWRSSPVDFTHATAFLPANYTYPATTGDATMWTTDAASALIWKKTDAAGKVVEFDYNARGQQATRKWARKLTTAPTTPLTTSYSYDSATGELLTTTYNDSAEPFSTPTVTNVYTRASQLDTVTDFAGMRDFVYDSSKPWRLTYETAAANFGGRWLSHLYETSGVAGRYKGFKFGTAQDSAAAFEQDYNYNATTGLFDNLVSQHADNNASYTKTFQYSYLSNAPLVSGYTTGSTFSVLRTYETDRNLLSSIRTHFGSTWTPKSARFDYTYNDRYERLTAKQSGTIYSDYFPGGASPAYSAAYTVYNYNSRGELQTSAMYLGNTPTVTPSSGDEIPGRRFEYRYDNIGNRTTAGATGSAGTADDEYASNGLNQYTGKENNTVRLFGTVENSTTVAVPGLTVGRKDRTWAADVVPGITPATGTSTVYSATSSAGTIGVRNVNWFTPPASQVFTYDDDGNLTADDVWAYVYDAENRLVMMQNPASIIGTDKITTANARRLEFAYDYMGRRVQKKVLSGWNGTSYPTTSQWWKYFYQGWNLVGEYNSATATTAGTLIRTYTWGLDLTGSLTASGGVGALIENYEYTTNTSRLPVYDGNGNVVALIRSAGSGTVDATYEYNPFGEFIRKEGAYVGSNMFTFSTKFMDAESGLLYYGLRYYSPTLGRFINKDPIEEQGGLNLYAFVSNNGVNRWDYLGLDDIFLGVEADMFLTGGASGGFGFVFDTDHWGQSGFYGTYGMGGGDNAGVGIAGGWAPRDIEGWGGEIDVNAGTVSGSLYFDGEGPNGASISWGPGVGASGSATYTSTLTVEDMYNAVRDNMKKSIQDLRDLFGTDESSRSKSNKPRSSGTRLSNFGSTDGGVGPNHMDNGRSTGSTGYGSRPGNGVDSGTALYLEPVTVTPNNAGKNLDSQSSKTPGTQPQAFKAPSDYGKHLQDVANDLALQSYYAWGIGSTVKGAVEIPSPILLK